MTNYIEFNTELLNELQTNDKLLREVNYSHKVCDKGVNFLHYCTMYGGKRYITNKELKDKANELYEQKKKEKINSLSHKLVFVGMGMDCHTSDINNHRIRTEILNPNGKRFFIEVGSGAGNIMRIDHVVNRDIEKEYEQKRIEYREKIEQAGGFWRIGKGHELHEKYQQYSKQPYYWYKHEFWKDLKLQYDKENVLKLVNELFECNFKEIEIDSDYLTTDDYISTSPNN